MDNINTQNSSGMMNGMPPQPRTEKKIGPIIGALIIILVLIIAALYFFGQKLNTENTAPAQTTEQTSMTNQQSMTATTATAADDVGTLNADLDAQLNDIDYSF